MRISLITTTQKYQKMYMVICKEVSKCSQKNFSTYGIIFEIFSLPVDSIISDFFYYSVS